MRYWLFKTEPACFSFDDLWRSPGRRCGWEGVRNYQARNFMLRDASIGDGILFYHSSCEPPGIAGLAEVASKPYPDPTQFDPRDPHFDATSTREEPRWHQVDVRALRPLPRFVALEELRAQPSLAGLELLKRGSRLSILPVSAAHWAEILALAGSQAPAASRAPSELRARPTRARASAPKTAKKKT
jgi:predicted RNA-binding protein with PUA-like domain